jgi:hypothetical protein
MGDKDELVQRAKLAEQVKPQSCKGWLLMTSFNPEIMGSYSLALYVKNVLQNSRFSGFY